MMSDEISDTYDFINVGVPSGEAPHRISLYSREPRRIGRETIQQISDKKQPIQYNLQKEKCNKRKQTPQQQKQTIATIHSQPVDPKTRTLSLKSHTSSESNV